MVNLTKNARTHYIVLTDGNTINLTSKQAELYQEEVQIKKHNEFIKIHDIDTDEILFNGRCSEIKRFVERKQDGSLSGATVTCGFGVKHELLGYPSNCNCKNEFDTLPITFKYRLRDDLGFNIFYDSDITEEMRKVYKQKYEVLQGKTIQYTKVNNKIKIIEYFKF